MCPRARPRLAAFQCSFVTVPPILSGNVRALRRTCDETQEFQNVSRYFPRGKNADANPRIARSLRHDRRCSGPPSETKRPPSRRMEGAPHLF
ncbi:hypothetical protein NMD1_00989 [Novosphingobium sp. MD-1]|nr:hypothetical protein NMD1_00989 [Novosphingobium sp. MD-1]